MEWYYILLIVICALTIIFFLTMYICFRLAFYVNRKKSISNELTFPKEGNYEPYKELIKKWMDDMEKMPYTPYSIKSFDGLTLCGKYYECGKGNVIEIMFHGYRGSAKRDLCGGIKRAFEINHNVLIVDQRTSGLSEGNVITFGVNEHKDCLMWIKKVIEEFGDDVKIILSGVSMGAATVINAASKDIPKNVIGVLADCGYSSQRDIIKQTIKKMHLPPSIFYPILKLSAKVYGKFNLEEIIPVEAIKNIKVPVIIYHGDADDYVPCEMAHILYNAQKENNHLVIVPKAGHGISYVVEPDLYIKEMKKFFYKS